MKRVQGFRKLLALVTCAAMVIGIVPGLVPEAKADETERMRPHGTAVE